MKLNFYSSTPPLKNVYAFLSCSQLRGNAEKNVAKDLEPFAIVRWPVAKKRPIKERIWAPYD